MGRLRLAFARKIIATTIEHAIAIGGRMVVIMFFRLVFLCSCALHNYNMSVLDIFYNIVSGILRYKDYAYPYNNYGNHKQMHRKN